MELKIHTPEREEEELFARYPALECCRGDVRALYEACARAFERGGKLLVAGNGGSAADSEHIVGELMKSFKIKRPADGKLAGAGWKAVSPRSRSRPCPPFPRRS